MLLVHGAGGGFDQGLDLGEAFLGDGYRIEARIVVWEGDNILKVPSSALFRRGQGWSAFTFANGRARRREVEVGHRAALEVEIVRGLEEGDEIIKEAREVITTEQLLYRMKKDEVVHAYNKYKEKILAKDLPVECKEILLNPGRDIVNLVSETHGKL